MTGGGMNGADSKKAGSGSRVKRVLSIAFVLLVVVLLLAGFWVKRNLYASRFSPVALGQQEREVLKAKMARFREQDPVPGNGPSLLGEPLAPEPYSEEGAGREIILTERELNALVANTPDIAERVAIDLSDDLISVKLVLPVDDEVPVLGGKRIKLHMGLTVHYEGKKPTIALKGVSLGGIPLPNAWLGRLKNVNLVEEFGGGGGFWEVFTAGIRSIRVRRGELRIELSE
jgi:hypothetical protein